MSIPTSIRNPEHRALRGARPWRDRIRAVGAASAPRSDAPVLSRGTHRTRVSEMRLTTLCAAARRPEVRGAGEQARRTAARREGGVGGRSGTG